jgi:hypothetical protein
VLRARGERPGGCSATKQRNKLASFQMIELHSIPASHGLLGYPIGQGQSAGTPDILQPAACLV